MGGEKKFTVLTATSLRAWQNKWFLLTLTGRQMQHFSFFPWFLKVWVETQGSQERSCSTRGAAGGTALPFLQQTSLSLSLTSL